VSSRWRHSVRAGSQLGAGSRASPRRGMFSYLDVSLVLLTAMVFNEGDEATAAGGADAEPHRATRPVALLLLLALTVVIMFPA